MPVILLQVFTEDAVFQHLFFRVKGRDKIAGIYHVRSALCQPGTLIVLADVALYLREPDGIFSM
jgi:hypothetical protein